MKKNINGRLVGIAIIAIISTFIGITTIYYGLFQKQVRSDLAITAKILKDTHYFETVNKNIDDEIDSIDFTADITELRVTWIDADGNVIYDNDVTSKGLENHMDRPEIQAAFKEGVGESVRRSDTMGKDTFYYATLLNNGTVLRVATDATSIWSVFISVAPVILLILLLIILLCVYLSHILTRQLLQPIEKMADNLEGADYESPYKELEPFLETIKSQHADVLSAAKARQDFTANVSHELKTPITAISGYTELLEGGMVDESQQKHFYQEIRKSSNRLLSLINDIIRLSELDRTEGEMSFEEISLYDLARECAEDLAVNASAKNVSLSFEGEECTVIGNRDMLRELIENLVQNAIRYNNENGKVTVVVSNDERPTLMVKDNGIGIPASEQQRVFERFYRVDKSRSKATGGTGLGLAIVKHIVEIHDAKIELDSAPGVGTTMTVIF